MTAVGTSGPCGRECNGTWPGPEPRLAFHVRGCPNNPTPRGAYVEDTGTHSAWLRLHVARAAVWPLWQVERLGAAASDLADRIMWWGERASEAGESRG